MSNTTKGTPGPWQSKPENQYVPAQVWADGRQLCEVYGESRDTRAANARLIAAAPELLAALRVLVETWDAGQLADPSDVTKARAALAAADGKV